MKHLNADLDNITNVQTIKTPVGAIRAIGVDSENDIVLTGASGNGDGDVDIDGDLDIRECDTQVVSNNFRFEDNTNTEFPKGANTVTLGDNSGFGDTFIYQLEIDDTTDLPTLHALGTDGAGFQDVASSLLTVDGAPNRGSVVIRYASVSRTGNALILGGVRSTTTVGNLVNRSFDFTTSTSNFGEGFMSTFSSHQRASHQVNTGGFNLTASNFQQGRIALINLQVSTAVRNNIISDFGISGGSALDQAINPTNFTFTSGTNNFTIRVSELRLSPFDNFVAIVGRSPFSAIQTDQFISGAGSLSPNGQMWSLAYQVGDGMNVVNRAGIEYVSGSGDWSRGDGIETATICIGDTTTTSADTPGISTPGDINVGGQITQGALNGPVFANNSGTLDVGNVYENTVPYWTGDVLDSSSISYVAPTFVTFDAGTYNLQTTNGFSVTVDNNFVFYNGVQDTTYSTLDLSTNPIGEDPGQFDRILLGVNSAADVAAILGIEESAVDSTNNQQAITAPFNFTFRFDGGNFITFQVRVQGINGESQTDFYSYNGTALALHAGGFTLDTDQYVEGTGNLSAGTAWGLTITRTNEQTTAITTVTGDLRTSGTIADTTGTGSASYFVEDADQSAAGAFQFRIADSGNTGAAGFITFVRE